MAAGLYRRRRDHGSHDDFVAPEMNGLRQHLVF